MQTEEVDEQQEQGQLKAETDALVAKENELLSRLGGKAVMKNLSLLTEEVDKENDKDTKQKYRYDDALLASKAKWREAEAMLAQMHSERENECQRRDAERKVEHSQWENDNRMWDNKCVRLKAQHQQGAWEKLELTDRVTSLRMRLTDVLQVDQFNGI